MKTWKLVSGILNTVLSMLVLFQSCAAGLAETLEENGGASGSAGLLVAVLMLSGGIVSVVTRKGGKGSGIALLILFGLAALLGYLGAGNFPDLSIWATWCLICAVVAVVSLIQKKKS